MLVWKCLNGTVPGYLSELCVLVASASGRQHLRSASTGLLQVPRARTMICRRSFAVTGPSLWNNLPATLWRPEMLLCTFERQLKAYICSTLWILAKRSNIHHRAAPLWRFRDSGAGYKTADLLTYLRDVRIWPRIWPNVTNTDLTRRKLCNPLVLCLIHNSILI